MLAKSHPTDADREGKTEMARWFSRTTTQRKGPVFGGVCAAIVMLLAQESVSSADEGVPSGTTSHGGAGAGTSESPYCRKVRAHAEGDAALMFAPTIQAQAIRYPTKGTIDLGTNVGDGFQVRGVATWSPLDFYKGFRVLRVADADCQLHESVVSAQEILQGGDDYGRLPALRKMSAFFDQHEAEWKAATDKAAERLKAHTTSTLDVNEVNVRVFELERKREATRADVSRLEAKNIDFYRPLLATLDSTVMAQSAQYEKELSHVRSLEPWDVRVTGGFIPHGSPDYFAMLQVGFNFGAPWRNGAESRYRAARADELQTARYEVVKQLKVFRQQISISKTQAQRELAIVEKKHAALESMRAALTQSDAASAPNVLAVLELELLMVDADQVMLSTLVGELSRLEGKN